MIDSKDVKVTVVLAEHHSRFLAGLVTAAMDHGTLTRQQQEVSLEIAAVFAGACTASITRLIEEYGEAAVTAYCDQAMKAYENVDVVEL